MNLELRRVFSGVVGRGRSRLIFDFFILPLLVSAIMTTAFLARSSPDTQRDSFLYFGTLYAFWCGLFGACQAFNGEVASGEWSYWMLGMRRSVHRHYAAHFLVAALFGVVQVAASLFFIWGLWKLGAVVKPLGFMFVSPEDGGPFVNQVVALMKGGSAYNLEGLMATMNHFDQLESALNCSWFCFCLKFYVLGAAAAIVAGVALGLLVSACSPSPQVSLTAAVLLVVSCTIFSHTGIRGNASSSAKVREFSPVSLIAQQSGSQFRNGADVEGKEHLQPRWRDGGAVEMASFILPQRYFFNIARTPCLEFEYSLGRGIDAGESRTWYEGSRLAEHSKQAADGCKCPVCIDLISMSADENGIPLVEERDGKTMPLENHWIGAGETGGWKDKLFSDEQWRCPGGLKDAIRENRGGIGTLLAFCGSIAWTEAAVLLAWCAVVAFLTLTILHKKGTFHELR